MKFNFQTLILIRKAFDKLASKVTSMDSTKSSSTTQTSTGAARKPAKMQAQAQHIPQLAHHEIHKTFDEADSLLQILSERKYNPATKENKVQVPEMVAAYHKQPVFTIRPKSEADVIEELQIVNSNLRNLVDQVCAFIFILLLCNKLVDN